MNTEQSCQSGAACCGCGSTAPEPPASAENVGTTVTYRIANMCCPTEEALIRRKLAPLPGVLALHFNLMRRELDVVHDLPSTQPVLQALHAIGMQAESIDGAAKPPSHTWQRAGLAIGAIAAALAETFAWLGFDETSLRVIALAVLAIFTAGLPTLRKGWIALTTLTLNINVLMSLAVIGAVAIGQWPEAAMVIVLFAIAEEIEAMSLDRARNSVHGLLSLAPELASVRGVDGSWQDRPADRIAVGTIVRVRPGERIALDGTVTEGQSSVDQSPITGESMPVPKSAGDVVYAGTINAQGLLLVTVTAQRGDSTLATIVRVLEETQRNQAPTQRLVDRFALWYTPAVVAAAVLVAALPPLLWQQPFDAWLYKALVLLVIACPCALVISTPVTVVSGLTAAARRGILVKGGQFLEAGHTLRVIALDKTGTLTAGQPTVVDVTPLAALDRVEILALAASLDAHSTHPLARAITAAAPAIHKVAGFENLPGQGVRGIIDGKLYSLGNGAATTIEQKPGCTSVVLADDSGALGVIAIADTLRPTGAEAVRALKELGIATVMLTGDNAATARHIAQQAGIDEVHAALLPAQKLALVEQLASTHGPVGMMGDGINDAPALARARVGFAMGAAGSDTAIEAADVALMDDDLRKLPAFIRLSRRTHRVLMQNIALALGIKAVFFTLALLGYATLWMAVFADVGASLLVVANGLRLLRMQASERP